MLSKLKILPALAAVAGGTVFSLGLASAPAQAACGDTVALTFLTGGGSVTCGDKTFNAFQSIDFGLPPTAPPVTVKFDKSGEVYSVAYLLGDGVGIGTYIPVYEITINDAANEIISYASEITGSGDLSSTTDSIDLLEKNPPPFALYEAMATLEVVDVAGEPPAKVTMWTQYYTQTPGPLPILGAGAAFGFSRKLRRRIKSVM